jgi:hypothetical protein
LFLGGGSNLNESEKFGDPAMSLHSTAPRPENHCTPNSSLKFLPETENRVLVTGFAMIDPM